VATVKLNVTEGIARVILKTTDGLTRVSCACCDNVPDACCMYPAGNLGVTYLEEDLPESVWFEAVDLWPTDYVALVERDGTTYGPHTEPSSGRAHRLRIFGGQWIYQIYENDSWGGAFESGNCLFESLEQDEAELQNPELPTQFGRGLYVVDNFADSYTATCTTIVGGQTVTTTKTYDREGLCVWRSRNQNGDVDGSLYYRTNASEQDAINFGTGRILWALSGAGFRTADDGPYNSPAGSYGSNGQCVVAEA
jgi:hypothetical protein